MIGDSKWQFFHIRVKPWAVLASLSILLIAYGIYADEPSSVYSNARIICTSCIGIR